MVGLIWIWAVFYFDGLREIIFDGRERRNGIAKFLILFGPFGYGVLMLIKGVFKLRKLV